MQTHRVGIPRSATRLRLGVLSVTAALVGAYTPAGSSTAVNPVHVAPPPAAAVMSPLAAPSFGNLPLSFEPNVGQSPADEKYTVAGAGAAALTSTGVVLRGGSDPVALKFVGASDSARLTATDELPGKSNYLRGDDPSKWWTNIPTYSKVRCEQLYPGVDLVWYGDGRSLEYDVVVEPGADPGAVGFELEGAFAPTVEPDGALVAGDVRLERPFAYQDADGARRPVASQYVVQDSGCVAFELGEYDRSLPLVIDPEIGYTYTFADANKDISIFGLAVDSSGAAYVAGRTRTAGAGGVLTVAAFVAKLNPEGTALVYSTTISGSAGNEEARDIAVDSTGNAFITGFAFSSNFPTTAGAFQTTKGSSNGTQDAFVAKLGPAGNIFVYSSFLGGSGGASGSRLIVDPAGAAFVTGHTFGAFPTTAPAQGTFGGVRDAFLAKVNAAGSSKLYSTYLGGSQTDTGVDVAVDSAGNSYVVGETTSTNFPVSAGAVQAASGGGAEAFWAKYDVAGHRLASTYLGGSGFDRASGIAVSTDGRTFVTGETDSAGFPLVAAIQATIAGDRDAFVAELSSSGTALVFSTFYGGSLYDFGSAVTMDESGLLYVVGTTRSSNFPLVDPVQPGFGGGQSDAFVLQMDPGSARGGPRRGAATLISSTTVGGSGAERGVDATPTNGGLLLGSFLPVVDTGGGGHEAGQLDQVIYALAPFVDLEVESRGVVATSRENVLEVGISIDVRNLLSCGASHAGNITLTVEIPAGFEFLRAGSERQDSFIVASVPPLHGFGTVEFVLPAGLSPEDFGTAYVVVTVARGTPAFSTLEISYSCSSSNFDCFRPNNSGTATVVTGLQPTVPRNVSLQLSTPPMPGSPFGFVVESLLVNGLGPTTGGAIGERPADVTGFRIYASSQPNVQVIEGNLFTTVPPNHTSVDVTDAPAGSFFVVTAVTDQGETPPSNEVGGVLPTITKLKVSGTKIVAQGTGFAAGLQVYFGGLSFTPAAQLKKNNTKVVQKGPLANGQSIGALSSNVLSPGSKVVVLFVNGNGNAVAAEYVRP